MYNLKVNPILYKKYNRIAIRQKMFDIKTNRYKIKYFIYLNVTEFDFITYSEYNFTVKLSVKINFTRLDRKGYIIATLSKYFDYKNCTFYCISA